MTSTKVMVKKNITIKSRTKALLGNYKRCTIKDIHPHIKFIMKEDDVHNWYFMMGTTVNSDVEGEFTGNDNEFVKGQFFGKITATNMYPYGPPDVEMLTPTGVFPINNNDFCIDIGKYHKDDYPASLGMDGYTKMIWSGLLGWKELGYGINLVSAVSKKKQVELIRKYSLDSQEYNLKNNMELVKMFQNTTEETKEITSVKNILQFMKDDFDKK